MDLSNPSSQSSISDNMAGGLAYFTILPAIIFLIVAPYSKNSYIRFHSWQSIFLFITWAVVDIFMRMVQGVMPSPAILTMSLWQLVDLAFFVAWLIVVINAFNGRRVQLPLVGTLAKRQAE